MPAFRISILGKSVMLNEVLINYGPTNNLTNICSEIIKIRMSLLVSYTYTMWGALGSWMGRRWMYFASLTKIPKDMRLE